MECPAGMRRVIRVILRRENLQAGINAGENRFPEMARKNCLFILVRNSLQTQIRLAGDIISEYLQSGAVVPFEIRGFDLEIDLRQAERRDFLGTRKDEPRVLPLRVARTPRATVSKNQVFRVVKVALS